MITVDIQSYPFSLTSYPSLASPPSRRVTFNFESAFILALLILLLLKELNFNSLLFLLLVIFKPKLILTKLNNKIPF